MAPLRFGTADFKHIDDGILADAMEDQAVFAERSVFNIRCQCERKQKGEAIASPGGYLRSVTAKARVLIDRF